MRQNRDKIGENVDILSPKNVVVQQDLDLEYVENVFTYLESRGLLH